MADWILWLIVIIILIVLEVMTVNLVSVWFIISGLVSLIVSIYIDNFLLQFGIFVIGGLVLMLFTKPLLSKYVPNNRNDKINLDRIIGMVGVVTVEISKNEIGEVKVDGKKWSAIASSKIAVDEEVIIEKIDGVKLIVKKNK